MNTAIVITLIICATLVVLSIVYSVSSASERKDLNKKLDRFSKAFPDLKNMEKRTKDSKDFKEE